MSDGVKFLIGNIVEKDGGDYTYSGEVRAVVHKRSGAIRYVVEDDRGVLFIFKGDVLKFKQVSAGDNFDVCDVPQ